jgi:hypothetical protein
MKIETLERTMLIADEGKILTDGENYGKILILAQDRKADEYKEITEKEYEEILKEQEGVFNQIK